MILEVDHDEAQLIAWLLEDELERVENELKDKDKDDPCNKGLFLLKEHCQTLHKKVITSEAFKE